jgi:hypothetical protein
MREREREREKMETGILFRKTNTILSPTTLFLFTAYKEYIRTTDDTVLSSICKGDSGGPAYLPSQVAHVLGFQGDVQVRIYTIK